MAFKFKTFAAVGALIGSLALVGCGQDEKDPNHIKVGVIVGAEQQVAEVAQKVAKDKYGLDVELVTFNDYVLPNEALSKGDIDANAFQHKPYLDQQLKDRGYKLVAVGNTFVYPIAGYSKKIKSLDELRCFQFNNFQIFWVLNNIKNGRQQANAIFQFDQAHFLQQQQ